MMEDNNNTYRFLLVLFGASVGSFLALIIGLIVLHFYRAQQLNKHEKDALYDIERQSQRSHLCNEEKSNNINNSYPKMALLNKDVEKRKADNQYLGVNNNTRCSSNVKTIYNAFDISSISSNDSINCVNKTNKKYSSLSYQDKIQDYSSKRFNPMCTSSPLPNIDRVYSTNDTFSIHKPTSDLDSSSDASDDRYSNLDPGTTGNMNQNQCNTPNSTFSGAKKDSNINSICKDANNSKLTKRSFLNSNNSILNYISDEMDYRLSVSKETAECTLFDPTYTYENSPNEPAKVFSSPMTNIMPMCCKRQNHLPTVVRYNFQKLCQTFGDTGKITYSSMEQQCTQKIILEKTKANIIVNNRHYYMATAMCEYSLWFTQRDFLEVELVLPSRIIEGSYVQDTKNILITVLNPTMPTKMENQKSQLSIQLNADNTVNVAPSTLFTSSRDINIDVCIENDSSWKGRSRQTIKK